MFRAMIPVPGSGAAREPDFADGVQAAVMGCMLAQLPESEHCTVREPASSIPAMSEAENGLGACSPVLPAGDDS
jgi:hypothetical protein